MLVFIEYPIWELLLYVGIYRISNMGIAIVAMLVFIEYPIWELLLCLCWYFIEYPIWVLLSNVVFLLYPI